MHSTQKKNQNSLLGIALTLFAVNKHRQKKNDIYWVIDEEVNQNEEITVKYYNEDNQLVHSQIIPGLKKGFLDEESMYQLNQIKSQILSLQAKG